jgi:hypothetical protein
LGSNQTLFNQVVTIDGLSNSHFLSNTSSSLGNQIEQVFAFQAFQHRAFVGGVQNELKKLGYTNVTTNGFLDHTTRKALASFQKLNRLPGTGQLTSLTFHKISTTNAVQISAAEIDTNSPQVASIKAYAETLAQSKYGWNAQQFQYLDAVWTDESGWNYRALNSMSGAYGIPQALPATKMATAGSDWETNPTTQVNWGEAYIASRYQDPENAWNSEVTRGFY